jgi:hypothetical protein
LCSDFLLICERLKTDSLLFEFAFNFRFISNQTETFLSRSLRPIFFFPAWFFSYPCLGI